MSFTSYSVTVVSQKCSISEKGKNSVSPSSVVVEIDSLVSMSWSMVSVIVLMSGFAFSAWEVILVFLLSFESISGNVGISNVWIFSIQAVFTFFIWIGLNLVFGYGSIREISIPIHRF